MLSKLFKRFGGALALSCLLGFAATPAKAQSTNSELVVRFKASATDAEIQHALGHGHLKVRRHKQTEGMKERGHVGLTLTETDLPADQAIERLKNHPAIDFVEPNVRYHHQAISNDSWVAAGNTWGLYGDLSAPANAYGSQAAEAWAAGYTGTNSVYVAVIDEGIDFSHPDLVGNIWNNPFEVADGADNDGNRYADDIHGFNFAANNGQVFDPTGDHHGTHVSGTIGATGGNGVGVAGVNWNVTIISGKFLTANGGDTLDAVEAIDYFVDLKKRHNLNLVAINASWGGSSYSRALHESIIRAAKAGILFVAAAGNDALNNDASASYPANIDTRVGTASESAATYDSVISVAAIDSNGALASFSNYGATKVHLGAPGVDILSTYPNSQVAYMSGTSMATPHVTGAVALYASTHPGASAATIRNAILGSVIPTPSLTGKCTTGGRLNLSTIIAPSVTAPPPPPAPAAPSAPTGVTASSSVATVSGNTTATVKWTASTGATSYKVKRATSSTGTWTVIATGLTGTTYSQTVTAGATYYYKVVATSSAGDSADSSAFTLTTVSPSPTPLTASAIYSTQVSLKWADHSADEQGFKIEYFDGASWIQLGTLPAGSTSAAVTGTASRTTYSFRIRAYNGTLNTAYSNTATVTTP